MATEYDIPHDKHQWSHLGGKIQSEVISATLHSDETVLNNYKYMSHTKEESKIKFIFPKV
jgi:hypothetical protein